jgi:hypothetical protein
MRLRANAPRTGTYEAEVITDLRLWSRAHTELSLSSRNAFAPSDNALAGSS